MKKQPVISRNCRHAARRATADKKFGAGELATTQKLWPILDVQTRNIHIRLTLLSALQQFVQIMSIVSSFGGNVPAMVLILSLVTSEPRNNIATVEDSVATSAP